MSLLSSFILMTYGGITLNSMSLVALILALGMLVDNAIVIMESIDRLRDEGVDVNTAAKNATNQVAPAVFSATLTTMAAFFPMAMIEGMMGQFLKSIPITIIFAIGSSFVISLSITPALCARFLSTHKVKSNHHGKLLTLIRKIISVAFVVTLSLLAFANNGKLELLSCIAAVIFGSLMALRAFILNGRSMGEIKFIKIYINILGGILRSIFKRLVLLIVAVSLFVGSVLAVTNGFLKIELMPSSDSTSLTIDIETPPGYLLEDTGTVVSKIEEIVLEYPEIKNVVSKVGSTGSMRSSGGSNTARVSIDLVPEEEREKSSTEMIDALRKNFDNIAGASITVEQQTMGPSSGKPINVRISGEDTATLGQVAHDVKSMLKGIDGTADVATSLEDGSPQLKILVDKERASALNVSISTITAGIRNALQGIEATTIKQNGEEIDIILHTNDNSINSVHDFENIYFTSNTGQKIQFSRVAYLEEAKGASAITHEDFKKVVSVESNVKDGINSTEVLKTLQEKLKDYALPEDTSISFEGEMRHIRQSFTGLLIAMLVAIFLVFLILSIQFNSLSQPLVILFSVPMAIIGAIGGLILTKNNFGVFGFMGIVSLVGIAVNDAIVLVDHINYLRKNGSPMIEAIKDGVRSRFLPVMATSITTIGGILPLALKNPDYAQMGFALIFGLIASTVLTLLFIPILYSIVEGLKIKIQRKIPIFIDRTYSKGASKIETF
jgi:HAE1 family hydrophobic/amphiphilic exporter-1